MFVYEVQLAIVIFIFIKVGFSGFFIKIGFCRTFIRFVIHFAHQFFIEFNNSYDCEKFISLFFFLKNSVSKICFMAVANCN